MSARACQHESMQMIQSHTFSTQIDEEPGNRCCEDIFESVYDSVESFLAM